MFKLYVDGQVIATLASTPGMVSRHAPDQFRVGAGPMGFCDGCVLAMVEVYSRAPTDQEVEQEIYRREENQSACQH